MQQNRISVFIFIIFVHFVFPTFISNANLTEVFYYFTLADTKLVSSILVNAVIYSFKAIRRKVSTTWILRTAWGLAKQNRLENELATQVADVFLADES